MGGRETIVKINLVIEHKNNHKHFVKEDYFYLNLVITDRIAISELIRLSVDGFNEKFRSENYKYLLENNYQNFHLKPSKKNGYPKTDIPGKFFLYVK